MKPIKEISEKGKDFKGRKLNEETLTSHVAVIYKKQRYLTGNIRHDLVELWEGSNLIEIVNTAHLQLIK